jgi:hypothetical protein
VLFNRGIASVDIEHYLNTTDDDIIDPHMLYNVDEGAKMLIKHISQGHKVLI